MPETQPEIVLTRLSALGFSFDVDDHDRLMLTASFGALTPDEIGRLRPHADAIRRHIVATRTRVCSECGWPRSRSDAVQGAWCPSCLDGLPAPPRRTDQGVVRQ